MCTGNSGVFLRKKLTEEFLERLLLDSDGQEYTYQNGMVGSFSLSCGVGFSWGTMLLTSKFRDLSPPLGV